jgi:hypothetical protein
MNALMALSYTAIPSLLVALLEHRKAILDKIKGLKLRH